jgi:DNA-binding XRE family transcriptional regulator
MSNRSDQLQTALAAVRLQRVLSQGDLAAAVGVSRQTISSIETGQYCPSTVLALRLASVLETTVEALFWLEGHTDAHPARS